MTTIEHRSLGDTDIQVPALGVGTVSWGDRRFGFGRTYTRDDLRAAYRTCLNAGLNYFDTSENYGGGKAEALLGEFHRDDGRPIVVSTKFSPASVFEPSRRLSPKAVMPTLDGSLHRLGLDSVDLLQLHSPPARRKLDDFLDALAATVHAGKARAIGVSNFDAELMRHAHRRLADQGVTLASNQVAYNLLARYPETNGVLDTCRELDVTLIAYAPLYEGVLSGKYRAEDAKIPWIVRLLAYIAQQDLSKQNGVSVPLRHRLFSVPRPLQRTKLEPMFMVMDSIADEHGKSVAQVALNWLVTSHGPVIPIPGAKNARQAADNAGALNWALTPDERDRISEAELASRQGFALCR